MDAPEVFWQWFTENEHRFRDVEGPHKESLLDEILEQLHAYCDALWFEVGGHPDGPCELVITAEGDRQHFESVRRLIQHAPALEGWEFIALKPPMGFDFVTEYEGLRLDPHEMWFLPLESEHDPHALGLRMTGPGYDEDTHEEFLHASLLVLDCGLGELAAAEDVQHVEACALPDSPEAEGFIELVDLPQYISWRKSKLEG